METRPSRRKSSIQTTVPPILHHSESTIITRPKRKITTSPTESFLGVYIYPKDDQSNRKRTIDEIEIEDEQVIVRSPNKPGRKKKRNAVLATVDDDSSQSSSDSIDLLKEAAGSNGRSRGSTVISIASSYTLQEKEVVEIIEAIPAEKVEKVIAIEKEVIPVQVEVAETPKKKRSLTVFCHQCKIRKPTVPRITCHTDSCTSIWCLPCINRFYLTEGAEPHIETAVILCPVCSGICHCPRCRKKSATSTAGKPKTIRPRIIRPKTIKIVAESIDYIPVGSPRIRASRKKTGGNLRKRKTVKLVKDFMDTDTESELEWKGSDAEANELKKRVKKWKGKGLEQPWNGESDNEDLDLELETIEDINRLPFNSPVSQRLLSPTPPPTTLPMPTKRMPTKWIEGPERRKRRKLKPFKPLRGSSSASDSSEYSYQAIDPNESFADSTIEEALEDLTPNLLPSHNSKPSIIYSNSLPTFVAPEDLTSPDVEVSVLEDSPPTAIESLQSNLLSLPNEELGSFLRKVILSENFDLGSLLNSSVELEKSTPFLPGMEKEGVKFFGLERIEKEVLKVLDEEEVIEVGVVEEVGGWEDTCVMGEELF